MKTTLYYKDQTSDKVYQAEIAPADGGFVVNFAYGRRGSTLATGTKTTSPVAEPEAIKIFNKLIAEKKAKGYTEGADGTPYVGGASAERVTGVFPQLLNEVSFEEVRRLIDNPLWAAQQKWNGKRIMIRKITQPEPFAPDSIIAINRKGLEVGFPEPVRARVAQIPGDFLLDGEMIGDCYHVFDIFHITRDGQIDAERSGQYHNRLDNLAVMVKPHLNVMPIRTAFTTEGKRALLAELEAGNAEGIVFKHLRSTYRPGRPAVFGDMLKFKFYATLSARVVKINAKRSVALALTDGMAWRDCGNVTIPPNKPIPPLDAVVEIRYLYATTGGILYQPTYLEERTDINATACLTSQLKYEGQENDTES